MNNKFLIVFTLLLSEENEVLSLLLLLQYRKTIRTRLYLTSDCLDHPINCPWTKFWKTADDQCFISLVSVDRKSFLYILKEFNLHYIVK